MSEFQHTKTYPPMKRRLWPWIAIPLAVLFCVLGSCAAYSSTVEPSAGRIVGEAGAEAARSVPVTPKSTATKEPAKQPAKVEPRKTISGDDVVHVGEDIPAGTYRAVEAIDGDLCYWKKSKDAEGANIIDNDIPTGGRPQVTLKKGQWFTSSGCPDWQAK